MEFELEERVHEGPRDRGDPMGYPRAWDWKGDEVTHPHRP